MRLRIPGGAKALPEVSRAALLSIAAAFFGLTALLAVWLWQSWGGTQVTRVADDVASTAAILFALACTGWAARASAGRFRHGWYAMTAGLAAWTVGQLIWTYYEVAGRDQAPFPSWADVGYLTFYVGAALSVLLLSAHDRGQSMPRLLLDGAIVAASVFLISWVTVLEPIYRTGSDSPLAAAVSVAYPIGDVVIVTIAWARAAAAYRASHGLLVAGLISIAVSDSVYAAIAPTGAYYTGHLIDLGWIAGCGLIGLAALRSVGEHKVDGTMGLIFSQARLWGPYLPLLIAFVIGMVYATPRLGSLPLAVAAGFIIAAVLVRQFVVLTENRRLLSDVARMAFRDQLTGLANRALFVDRVEQAVARRRREDESIAVLCLDLDDFKTVNDELGHPAGDELLIRVARRLTECLRGIDTVARLGGDEFAVLMAGSPAEARTAAERVLETFDEPIVIDGISLSIRPSIGLTVATADNPYATVDDLLKHADLAMYAAKRDGGGCVRSFAPDLPNPFDLPRASTATVRATLVTPTDDPMTTAESRSVRAPSLPPTDIRVALSALAIGVVTFAAFHLLHTAPGRIAGLDGWFESALFLSAAAVVAARAYRVRTERAAWAFVAAGMAATGCGTVMLELFIPDGQSPSAGDPLFLASFPLVYVGLVLLVRARLRYAPGLVRLDAVIAALTTASVAAALMSGLLAVAQGQTLAMLLVAMAYPIGSVMLLALAMGSIAILGWRAELRWLLVVIGFALWVLASIAYSIETARGSYERNTWIEACWPVAFLLLAVAAWLAPATSSAFPRLGPITRFGPPGVCAAVALAVAILAPAQRLSVTLAALTLTVIAVRFAVGIRDLNASDDGVQTAMTDELTGLLNRRGLISALQKMPNAGRGVHHRPAARLALLLIDVNQFDEINAAFDRAVGDDLLRRIAERLSQAVGPSDLVARTGGDEFAVLITGDVNLMTARAHAGSLMDTLRPPFALDHLTVQVDVSIAIAMWPEHCAQPEEALSRAEAAMPKARSRETGIAVYNAAVDLQRGSEEQLVDDLRATLSAAEDAPEHRAGQLICHYQPKICADGGRVHSVEALVRWQHPWRGELLPDQFLAAAERAGLMRLVATRVLDIALSQIRLWRDQDLTLTVAVNLSATNLLDVGLVGTIEALLTDHDVPAACLILEITEDTLAADSQRARNTVNALQRLGIRLSLDDYGTGWSSLARLQDLSVDELKLDRVFVARLSRDPRSIAIVRSTVALAHSLGADLVAEGVEDAATLHALRQYGCSITQGHVHSPPLPADELHEWMLTRSPDFARAASPGSDVPE